MSDTLPPTALPSMADVEAAAARLGPWIRRTPILRVQGPGAREVVLKLEGLQRSGSFKLRGALNKVMLLGEAAQEGVVTASGGNHGIGVAWAAWFLGLRAHVCVPSTSPPWKLQALEAANAEVEIVAGRYPDAEIAARAYARAYALPYIHAYDDPAVIAGQGTLVQELIADAPDVGTIVVAVGGGGLVAGAVVAAAGRRIVGVEPCGAPTMHAALRADTPITLEHIESVAADALGAGRVGDLPFHLCREGLDRVELVEDAAILDARRWLWAHTRIAVEAGAAVGVAALARGLFDRDPGPIGIILCGSNTDPATLA